LEIAGRRDRQRARGALEGAHEVPVPRVARVGDQDLVARVDVQRCEREQTSRRTGSHCDAGRGNLDTELGLVMSRNRLAQRGQTERSEEYTSELQSRENLVCRLLLEKKKKTE